MLKLLSLLNQFHSVSIQYGDWEFYFNNMATDQRTVLNHKFLKRLISKDLLDIDWFEWEYEFLLSTLSERDLVDYLLPRLK